MFSLAKRVVQQTLNDKRSLAMIIFAPILMLTLLNLLLGDTDYTPNVAVAKKELPAQIVKALEEAEINLIDLKQAPANSKKYLEKQPDVDAVFTMDPPPGKIVLYEASSKSGIALSAIQKALAQTNPNDQLATEFVYGQPDATVFDAFGYVFLGVFSFFMIFIISAMVLVKERSSGTLERLLMTPIKRGEVIMGYTLGYSLFSTVQAILIVVYSVYVLKIPCAGNVFLVILSMILLAITAVSFGAMISVFASSELQVVQFIPIAITPQIFFSGLVPLDMIPYNLGNICYVTPVYYGCSAIKQIIIYGNGFSAIWIFLLALLIYTAILYTLNTLMLKKFRTI